MQQLKRHPAKVQDYHICCQLLHNLRGYNFHQTNVKKAHPLRFKTNEANFSDHPTIMGLSVEVLSPLKISIPFLSLSPVNCPYRFYIQPV